MSARSDQVVDIVELPRGFGSKVDPTRHELAAHLASKRARKSSAEIGRVGSATACAGAGSPHSLVRPIWRAASQRELPSRTVEGMPAGTRVEIKSVILHWPGGREADRDSTDFRVGVQVLIGEIGEDAADSFDLVVCSPSKLAEIYAPDNWDADHVLPGANVLPITGLWLMRTCSEANLRSALDRLIAAYSPGPDFGTIAARIGRVIPWEYDYRFDDHQNDAAGLPSPRSFWDDED